MFRCHLLLTVCHRAKGLRLTQTPLLGGTLNPHNTFPRLEILDGSSVCPNSSRLAGPRALGPKASVPCCSRVDMFVSITLQRTM